MTATTPPGYAGDVSAKSTWDALKGSPEAVLVDVRSRAEWAYVGVPDLAEIGKTTVLIAWNDFDTGTRVPDFRGRLDAALTASGTGKDAPLYFICRSGSCSRNAAIEATAGGYAHCFNVEYGFEGNLSPEGHRGTAGSWKAEGLPWTQT